MLTMAYERSFTFYPVTAMNRFLFFFLLTALAFLASPITAAEPKLTQDGIQLPMRGIDHITFGYPQMLDEKQQAIGKIIEKNISDDGKKAIVKFDNGATAELLQKDGGLIELRFANPPTTMHMFRLEANIPFAMNEGGTYRIDEGTITPFPMQKPDKPHLFQGHPKSITLTAPGGDAVKLSDFPEGTYLQLQDNREWNWPIFQVWYMAPYYRDHAFAPLRFTFNQSTAEAPKMVDRFGQDPVAAFPGKMESEEELRADIEADKKFYASFPKPGRDEFGGLPGIGKVQGLKKTGFFHAQKVKDRWYLVDPAGNAFFHLGICCFEPSNDFTYTEGRESIFEWLPSKDGEFATAWHENNWWHERAFSFYVANCIRKFGKPYERNEWTGRMIDRVRALGFTSSGSFSAIPEVMKRKNFPHVRSFEFWGLGFDIPGARGFFDPFHPELAQKIDKIFSETVAPHANDELLIGYYLANEQGAEDLPKAIAALDGSFATKKALIEQLKKRYQTIADFNKAWEMTAKNFDELAAQGLPLTTRAASEDMAAFVTMFLDKYYGLLAETFRKYDKNHLLLGSRWQPGTANNETLVRTCAKYCDVISVNYYSMTIDRDYLDRLYRWSGEKPFLLSEWHFSSSAESGLPGGLGPVNSQRERGLAYRNYVEQAAATGYVVGIEWFTLVDQARAGRYFERHTGERANTGLFAVTDRPWKDFVTEAAITNARIEAILLGRTTPFHFDDPRFQPKGGGRQTVNAPWVATPLQIDGSRDAWPGMPPIMFGAERLALGTDAEGFSAAFRTAWDEKNLYLFIDVMDKSPCKNDHNGADLWQGDGIELFIGGEDLDKPGSLLFGDRQILLGAGKQGDSPQSFVRNAASAKQTVKLHVVAKSDGTGYFLEAAVPFTLLDIKPRAGLEILFDIAVDDSDDGKSRRRQFVWNGNERVSGDRGCWGKLKLTK